MRGKSRRRRPVRLGTPRPRLPPALREVAGVPRLDGPSRRHRPFLTRTHVDTAAVGAPRPPRRTEHVDVTQESRQGRRPRRPGRGVETFRRAGTLGPFGLGPRGGQGVPACLPDPHSPQGRLPARVLVLRTQGLPAHVVAEGPSKDPVNVAVGRRRRVGPRPSHGLAKGLDPRRPATQGTLPPVVGRAARLDDVTLVPPVRADGAPGRAALPRPPVVPRPSPCIENFLLLGKAVRSRTAFPSKKYNTSTRPTTGAARRPVRRTAGARGGGLPGVAVTFPGNAVSRAGATSATGSPGRVLSPGP